VHVTIMDWPEDERPRERLLAHGPQVLSDAELVALFLQTEQPDGPRWASAVKPWRASAASAACWRRHPRS
jgi:aspartyl/asparaginyl beta-hydroxylase (cupin superfamily)